MVGPFDYVSIYSVPPTTDALVVVPDLFELLLSTVACFELLPLLLIFLLSIISIFSLAAGGYCYC